MDGSAPDSVGTSASWLRCYRCWSQNLEVQVHYEGVLKVDPETGEAVEPIEEVQEATHGVPATIRSQRSSIASMRLIRRPFSS